MKKVALLSLTLLGMGLLGSMWVLKRGWRSPSPPAMLSPSSTAAPPLSPLQYKTHALPDSVVHMLLIPAQSRFVVTLAVADGVKTLEQFAAKDGAIAVLNGGFFDPTNQQSTSYITLGAKLVADPKQNQRLMANPDLAPYLEKILNRTEFRRYECGSTFRYDIVRHQASIPAGCRLVDALGAGAQLLPDMTLEAEGFVAMQNGQVVRDALGSAQPNARTAIGITEDGSILWVMVAQQSESILRSGMTLKELATFMRRVGVQKAMNLDGGSSASLYYQGKTVYGKVDERGDRIQRPVKSVLLVR